MNKQYIKLFGLRVRPSDAQWLLAIATSAAIILFVLTLHAVRTL